MFFFNIAYNFFEKLFKITGQITIVIFLIFFSTCQAKNFDKFDKASNISNYFSGILLLNQNKYAESYIYLKKLDGLENNHTVFSSKYLYTLVNSGKFNQAFLYSKKLEKDNLDSFETDIINGIYYLKNSKNDLSSKYFLKAFNRKSRSLLDEYVANSLHIWSGFNDIELEQAKLRLDGINNRFENLKKIQNTFLHCFYNSDKTEVLFDEIISNKETDFSRYNFFYAKYLVSKNKDNNAKKIISNSLIKHPRNLLLNQFKQDLQTSINNLNFNCKNIEHVVAEILYITANALSSQSIYPLSNFYLNLSKFLNNKFYAFDTLLAENFYKIEDYEMAKKIYKNLSKVDSIFKWYSNKQIARILLLEEKKDESIDLMNNSFEELPFKGIYQIFDYAEFLKNNEKFQSSIKHYTDILNLIDTKHPLYPQITDSRGVAYERLGEWEKAEKDLLSSLEADSEQAYVINYLAYSWIEKGINIDESLKMLEKANKIKSNDPYIIDSLGWALFKLKRYEESKKYLQIAVRLMPADPIVNDHYGDVLWKNGKAIQARYYWNYVLSLEKVDKDLKEKIEKKLITGL